MEGFYSYLAPQVLKEFVSELGINVEDHSYCLSCRFTSRYLSAHALIGNS